MILLVSALLVVVGVIGYFLTRSSAPKPAPATTFPTLKSTAGKPSGAAAAAVATPQPSADDESLCPLTVFYGSQTGSAEGFSKQIVNEAKKHGFKPKLVDLEDFDAATAFQPHSPAFPPLCIFAMATYGEGDPTDNASEFVKWLKDPVGAQLAVPAAFTAVRACLLSCVHGGCCRGPQSGGRGTALGRCQAGHCGGGCASNFFLPVSPAVGGAMLHRVCCLVNLSFTFIVVSTLGATRRARCLQRCCQTSTSPCSASATGSTSTTTRWAAWSTAG